MYFTYIVFLFPLSSWVMLLALRLGIVYTVCLSLSVHCGSLRSGNLYAICLQLWCSPGFPLWLGCWWHSHQGIKNSFWAKRKSLFYVFGGYATIVIPPSSLFHHNWMTMTVRVALFLSGSRRADFTGGVSGLRRLRNARSAHCAALRHSCAAQCRRWQIMQIFKSLISLYIAIIGLTFGSE